jgi:small-conductance mechanosensitive channel
VALWIGFVLQALGVLRLGDWLERRFGLDIVGAAASLLAIVLVGFGAWLAISTWIEYRLTPHGGRVPTAREHTLLSLLRNAAAIVILLVGLYYALLGVGISLAPLLASAGVIALAISWGSQKLVQDIITGLFIQLENAINVGDVVEAGGKIGVVEKLTIRSVSLRDVEGVYHLIPFSSVDAVSNHMKGFSYHVADISVAYGADIDAAKAAMLAAYDELAENPDWSWRLLGEIEWFGVQALADSAVILRARLKTRPGEQWAIGRAYAEAAKKRLDAAGIEIPFPQRKLWLETATDADRLPGRLEPTRQTRAAGAPTDAGEGHDGDEP